VVVLCHFLRLTAARAVTSFTEKGVVAATSFAEMGVAVKQAGQTSTPM